MIVGRQMVDVLEVLDEMNVTQQQQGRPAEGGAVWALAWVLGEIELDELRERLRTINARAYE